MSTLSIYDVKTPIDSYAYAYYFISQNYNLYFKKTLIFIFYTFILFFGQLRDLGIHTSDLFKYEQYAIFLIIAIDRIIISFNKELQIIKDNKGKEMSEQLFNDKINEITEQFELLLKLNPDYDIEKLDLWENTNNSAHPQTKLLYLYLTFNFLSKNKSDKVDELFILTGKNVKNTLI